MPTVQINKIAVLGAGVMGAQIAAHCVNAGIETYLYDLAADGSDSNAIVNKALKNLAKLKPSPLATKMSAGLIQAKNYKDNMSDLTECDLVIEAIAENMEYKTSLYQMIAPYINSKAILASNTSGLSITQLAELLPEGVRPNFCGIHFFNPPRYMPLVEIIPHTHSDNNMMDELESFLVRFLGKSVVRAKDTPNFIANRIGVFSLLTTLYHAQSMGLGFDEVDALTGTLIGRPKSATFRTMDVVGLDTMQHVVKTMEQQLGDDPWASYFKLPQWLVTLIDKGCLGQKSGAGIYCKKGKAIHVFDVEQGDYREAAGQVSDEVKQIFAIKDNEERYQKLNQSQDKQAQFLAACFNDLFHYCAHFLADIAETTRDVDLAIRWGFGWHQGPFELWQLANYTQVLQQLNNRVAEQKAMANVALPKWIDSISAFYQQGKAYSAGDNQYHARSDLAVYKRQYYPDAVLTETAEQGTTVFEDDGVRLWHQGDDIAILSFKSKVGAISDLVVSGMLAALDIAVKEFKAVVIYRHDVMNFSAGADLNLFSRVFEQGKIDAVEKLLTDFQRTVMAYKYSPIPIVAAFRGRALGGGCEVLLHCDRIVAGFEAYAGLVEIGVGVIPAGGGCKEFALRAAKENSKDPFVAVEKYYKNIAMAQVSASAVDAFDKGFMRAGDSVVMNSHEVLFVAKQQAAYLVEANYRPPLAAPFKVCGRDGAARLQMLLANMLEGHFISEYDYHIANKIAHVICGGDVASGQMVTEEWLLKLELDAFLELATNEKTAARVKHLMNTGKPLRN